MPAYIPNFDDYEDFSAAVSKLSMMTYQQMMQQGKQTPLFDLSHLGPGLLGPELLSIKVTHTPKDSLNIGTNKILYDDKMAGNLKNHRLYKWLSKNTYFDKSLQSFKRTKEYKKYKTGDAELLGELEFMHNCLLYMIWYVTYSKDHPPKVVTKTIKNSALKPINELLKILDAGIEHANYTDTYKLRSLLIELDYSIKNNAPSLSANRDRGYLRERWFVQHVAVHFKRVYGEYLETVIGHLLSAMNAHDISKSTLDDWILEAKAYCKHINIK